MSDPPNRDARRNMRRACCAAAVVLSLRAACAAAGEEPAPPPPMPGDTTLDEIIVTARSLVRLQNDAIRAQESFYAAFNATNSDHEFDVHCTHRTLPSSHIEQRVCIAKFVETLEAEAARAFRQGDPPPPTDSLIAAKNKVLREEMLKVANENPAVAVALLNAANARKLFTEEWARRCEGRILFCKRR